jgi:hypothetical protein
MSLECKCGKQYSHKSSLSRHKQKDCIITKYEKKINKLNKEIKELKSELKKGTSTNNIKNENNKIDNNNIGRDLNIINNVTNINININTYGCENLSYITDKIKLKLMKQPKTMLSEFTKKVHCSQEHPENRNIRVKNIDQPIIELYKNKDGKKQWTVVEKDKFLEKLFNSKKEYILKFGSLLQFLDEKETKQYYKYTDTLIDDDQNKKMKDLFNKDIMCAIISNIKNNDLDEESDESDQEDLINAIKQYSKLTKLNQGFNSDDDYSKNY